MLLSAVSVAYWQNAIAESEHRMASQADYEDETLCVKFGFTRGSGQHDSCKLDLLVLRHTHENELMARSLP
jgi:hypothetical protein